MENYLNIVDDIIKESYIYGYTIKHLEYKKYYAVWARINVYGYEDGLNIFIIYNI